MAPFCCPPHAGRAGEEAYARLRAKTEHEMGRAPNRRRISELWSRRGSLDCVTTVGAPDPVSGDLVIAIFDMGPQQPFVLYHELAESAQEQLGEVLGCSSYSVTEFS